MLSADLYRPPAPNGCGVLLIHGGSYVQGDRTQLRGYGILLGRLGYTCLACEYRLAPASKWPAQLDDVHTALRYLHDHARCARSRSRPDRRFGQLGRRSAVAHGRPRSRDSPVAAAIAFYPPTDFLGPGLRALGAPDSMSYLVGDDTSHEHLATISPVNYVNAEFPPTMILTGNRDEVVEWHDSLSMYLGLIDAGARAELHVFDDQPHAFDAAPDFGRQCAALMDLFLDRNLLAG